MSWMWMTLRALCFSPILCCSVEIRDRRCWRRRTLHSTQLEWTVVGICVCNNMEGFKIPCRMLQNKAFQKIHLKKRWFLRFLFVFRSVDILLDQICSCCTFCNHFVKGSPPFRCQLQRRGCAYETWCGVHHLQQNGRWWLRWHHHRRRMRRNTDTRAPCPSGSSSRGLLLLRQQIAVVLYCPWWRWIVVTFKLSYVGLEDNVFDVVLASMLTINRRRG